MRVATSGMAESVSKERKGQVRNAILIAGPTASGKSSLALKFARENGGVIVNADSMQVYSVLDVLTARPSPTDLAEAPHRLYGHVHPATPYSTGTWLRDVNRLIESGELAGRTGIFVGGTGLYFRALTEGISAMPDIPAALREHWRQRLAEEGPAVLHRLLQERDPGSAKALRPSDGQRLARALEVFDASGRSILEWQAERGVPLVDPESARQMVIEPDRAVLAQRIEQRFDKMLESGAMHEAAAMSALALDPALPATKAIGVRELQSVIAGGMTLEDARERAIIATRQYAKRQMTWFRNQFGPEWTRISAPGA